MLQRIWFIWKYLYALFNSVNGLKKILSLPVKMHYLFKSVTSLKSLLSLPVKIEEDPKIVS